MKGLACGPYEHAEETTEYLQRQPPRSVIPEMFPQTLFSDHVVGVSQSPYLNPPLQGGSVSTALPDSQESAQSTIMENDPLPAASFDIQDSSRNTASGPTESSLFFTPPTEHSRSQANQSEDYESEIISP